jgi:hypothetical protein
VANTRWFHCTRRLGALLLLAAVSVSCGEDINYVYAPTGIAAQVAAIRLTGGPQSMTIFKDGKVTLGPLIFVRPNVPITATPIDAQGNAIANAETAVRVNMDVQSGSASSGSGIAFTRAGPFTGTLRANNPGTSNFTVVLFDVVARRNVFGPYYVAVVAR